MPDYINSIPKLQPVPILSLMKYRLLMLAAFALAPVALTPVTACAAQKSEDMLIKQAQAALTSYKLTSLKRECLAYQVDRDQNPGFDTVLALEVHNKECGGDPDTMPTVATIAIERKTGAVYRYNPEIDELEPLSK